MKKILFSLISITILASCSYDVEVPDYQKVTNQLFEEQFIATFGQPQETHTWGFRVNAKTRASNNNGNMWYQTYERPTNVTEDEIAWAKTEFGKVRENATHTQQITWENYWVQQVYTGTRGSINGNGQTVYPKDVMNQFCAWRYNTNVIQWWPYEWNYASTGAYEHVNNFNNADNKTVYKDDETSQQYIGTTLMENMLTDGRNDQFAYHNTSDSKYHSEYIILEHNGAYFIGFDIVGYHPIGQDANANMDVTRDWIFDDWIIKISPALPAGSKKVIDYGRIIVEDLGSSEGSDFDYNDVVFDFYIYNDYTVEIELQAAGGTLPLFIDGIEVHEKFGVTPQTMVNTISYNEKDPVKLTLPTKYTSATDIPVTVKKGKQLYSIEWFQGKPSAKISVPTSFQWTHERVPVETIYPKFKEFVKDQTVDWVN